MKTHATRKKLSQTKQPNLAWLSFTRHAKLLPFTKITRFQPSSFLFSLPYLPSLLPPPPHFPLPLFSPSLSCVVYSLTPLSLDKTNCAEIQQNPKPSGTALARATTHCRGPKGMHAESHARKLPGMLLSHTSLVPAFFLPTSPRHFYSPSLLNCFPPPFTSLLTRFNRFSISN